MNKVIKTSLSMLIILVLVGCSTYSETFECPPGSGVGCKSISEVDQMIDEGKLSDEQAHKELPIDLASYKPMRHEELPASSLSSPSLSLPLKGSTVLRVPEQHLRIWIAAFQDEKGNLFSESFVHTVLKPGEWQVKSNRVREEPEKI
ncbi:MAG: TraV family lipoprotein [Alphaproteobacteria bacterium]|nr:TraV family lipoprotein [Alphaproteobacteria bacterium]